jgi:outer membrane receptor protein involved in Fe transport
VLNTHAIKAGLSVERGRKDQNFQNNETVEFIYSNWGNGTTGNVFGDTLTARPSQAPSGTASAIGNFQLWNIDFFLQDSWKLKKNFTLEYGVRLSKMTNNIERNGRGARFDASRYNPALGAFRDDSKTYMNGVSYAELGEVPESLVDNRPLYVMPRVNFAWDLKSNGDLIVRGGAGLFYNRPMGNAEYDVIHYAPYAYAMTMDSYSRTTRRPAHLRLDRRRRPVLVRRRHRHPAVGGPGLDRLPALLHDQPVGRQADPLAAVPRGRLRRDVRAGTC